MFQLRAFQIGLSFSDLFMITKGELIDMIIEMANDHEKYDEQATQEDIDHFFD